MLGTPQEWNVIVLGAWNQAILTPKGVARRLLNLPEGTPIEVFVAVDLPGSIKVSHGGVVVSPARGVLLIEPSGELTAEGLGNAAVVAQRALEILPETPVTAAGVNLKYRVDALPDQVLGFVESGFDDLLADANHTITGRFLRRSIAWQAGTLNIEIDEKPDASGIIGFNFHCASENPVTLREWLGRVAEMATLVENLSGRMTNHAAE